MPSCQFLFLFIFWLRLPSRPSRWPPRGQSPPWPGPWRTLSWIIRVWASPRPSQTPSPTRPPAPVAQLSCSHSCHRHLLFAWVYFICNYYLYQCDFNIWLFSGFVPWRWQDCDQQPAWLPVSDHHWDARWTDWHGAPSAATPSASETLSEGRGWK